MISKETTEEIRSQAVKECRILSGVCRSDGVEGEKLVYGLEIILTGEEWIRFSDISPRREVVEKLAEKLHGKSVWIEALTDIVEDYLMIEEGKR